MTDCQSGSGHVSPEAAAGGPITPMEAGHIIEIDVPNRRVSLSVPDSELESRRAAWKRPARKINYGSVARYATQVISADSGAVLVQPVF